MHRWLLNLLHSKAQECLINVVLSVYDHCYLRCIIFRAWDQQQGKDEKTFCEACKEQRRGWGRSGRWKSNMPQQHMKNSPRNMRSRNWYRSYAECVICLHSILQRVSLFSCCSVWIMPMIRYDVPSHEIPMQHDACASLEQASTI